MSPFVAAFIASSLLCSEPALDFRSFYARLFVPHVAGRWQGYRGEDLTSVFIRQSEASADFLEYRVARMERCR